MKRWMAIAIALAFLAACSAQAEPTKLVYKFTKGELDQYRTNMSMSMSLPAAAGGQMSMTMDMVMRQRTLDVYSDGSAKVRVNYSCENMSFAGQTGGKQPKMPQQQPVTVVMVIAPDGRVKSVEGMEKALANARLQNFDLGQVTQMTGLTALFPENEVDLGYTWKQTIPIPFCEGSMNISSTILSMGEKVWSLDSVKIGQDFDGNIDLTKLFQSFAGAFAGAAGGQSLSGMSGVLTLSGKMDYDFAPAIGKILKGRGNMSGKLTMSVPGASSGGGSSSFGMDMLINVSMTRFK